LILTGTKDLLNPEFEPQLAARAIKDVRAITISPGTVTGHASAGGGIPADVEFLNREIGAFLDAVTIDVDTLSKHSRRRTNCAAWSATAW
jgi:homoserine O-acetyltransferase/O-succinyltransferase